MTDEIIRLPGIFNFSPATYHADPCPEPSLSSGVARTLVDRSPRHAWMEHPRLNPAYKPKQDQKFDLGAAAHTLVLGDERAFRVIEADEYRSKAAKKERQAAYDAGEIPVLTKQWQQVQEIAAACRAQLDAHRDAAHAFRPDSGTAEVTLVWREDDVWCRAMVDWLVHSQPMGAIDYKTTSASAHPDAWGQRGLFDGGYDLQLGFYRRGLRALYDEEPRFRFVVQENEPPYALSVIGLTPAALDLAERRAIEAIEIWRRCMAENRWPGYPDRTCWVDPPLWHEKRWLEREDRQQLAREQGEDLLAAAMDWQAPLGVEETE